MFKIDEKHLKNVCKLGGGAFTCSYLGMGDQGIECLKGTEFQNDIKQRRAKKSMNAMGDNCSGPPKFESIQEIVN